MMYCRHWTVLRDGCSDWLYARDAGRGVFIFIEVIDLPAHCGSDAGDIQWVASVDSVDLSSASQDTIAGALDFCGYDGTWELTPIVLAEMMHSYGAKSPLWDESASNGFASLRKRARLFADSMLDNETRNEVLDTRIVNQLGQTAREFAGGTDSLWETLRRIKDNPDATQKQKLVLKMYQNVSRTLGAGPVPEDIRDDS